MKQLNWICVVLLSSLLSVSVHAEWAVLGNNSVPKEFIDTKELKRLFFGRISQWEGGGPVKLCFVDDSTALVEYLDEKTRYSKKRFLAYWNSRLFSGDYVAPKKFKTSEELVDYVARTRGALCITDPQYVPEGFSGKVIQIK
ncbi:MAG: hypothetical protein COB04_08140 [Gammaproteobacteria bacterium]|nr:MAG: hypothetical protein COB04_08140 [Gammaproteobacteria bacterium]